MERKKIIRLNERQLRKLVYEAVSKCGLVQEAVNPEQQEIITAVNNIFGAVVHARRLMEGVRSQTAFKAREAVTRIIKLLSNTTGILQQIASKRYTVGQIAMNESLTQTQRTGTIASPIASARNNALKILKSAKSMLARLMNGNNRLVGQIYTEIQAATENIDNAIALLSSNVIE